MPLPLCSSKKVGDARSSVVLFDKNGRQINAKIT